MQKRIGIRIAFIGLIALFVGLSVDAILHTLDVNLAAKEGIFTLENPGHLLLISGIALVSLGVIVEIWHVYCQAVIKSNERIFSGAALVIIISLGFSTAGFTLTTTQSHPHESSGVDWGNPSNADIALAQVVTTTQNQGVKKALDQLQLMSSKDSIIRSHGHDLAHIIGKYAYHNKGGISQFANCREVFQSGCYHGVLEAYFQYKKDVNVSEIRNLCSSLTSEGQLRILYNECNHGLGHGLTAKFDHNIFTAIDYCEKLLTDAIQACLGGVFMENAVNEYNFRYPESKSSLVQHKHSSSHRSGVRENDVYYPCNSVKDRQKLACWAYQTSIIQMIKGYDYEGVFQACNEAPKEWIFSCNKSLGKEISNANNRDIAKVIDGCQMAKDDYRIACYTGAINHMIDVTWNTEKANLLCKTSSSNMKSLCFKALGKKIVDISRDYSHATILCNTANKFYSDCISGVNERKVLNVSKPKS